MIDDQVHFREPGLTDKADLASESRAAVAGGITSFMDMPNVKPPTIDNEALVAKLEMARGRCRQTTVSIWARPTTISRPSRRWISPARPASRSSWAPPRAMLVDDESALDAIFEHAPLTVLTHCEDTPMIEANAARARERYGDDVPMRQHPVIRSREACYASSTKAIGLAKKHGTQLHILHITTAEELDLFAPGPMAGKQITAEACVHHLFFTDADYAAAAR